MSFFSAPQWQAKSHLHVALLNANCLFLMFFLRIGAGHASGRHTSVLWDQNVTRRPSSSELRFTMKRYFLFTFLYRLYYRNVKVFSSWNQLVKYFFRLQTGILTRTTMTKRTRRKTMKRKKKRTTMTMKKSRSSLQHH